MEVRYHIRPYFRCISEYPLKFSPYMVGTSNLGSWNGHWINQRYEISTFPKLQEPTSPCLLGASVPVFFGSNHTVAQEKIGVKTVVAPENEITEFCDISGTTSWTPMKIDHFPSWFQTSRVTHQVPPVNLIKCKKKHQNSSNPSKAHSLPLTIITGGCKHPSENTNPSIGIMILPRLDQWTNPQG